MIEAFSSSSSSSTSSEMQAEDKETIWQLSLSLIILGSEWHPDP